MSNFKSLVNNKAKAKSMMLSALYKVEILV